MFSSLYVAAMRHLRPSEPGWAAKGWLGEVHLHNGIVTRPWISSLSAFWPGLQATIGLLPFNYMQYQAPGILLARWRSEGIERCPTYVPMDWAGQPRAGWARIPCTSASSWAPGFICLLARLTGDRCCAAFQEQTILGS